jgi:hypothetical protein
MNIDNTYFNLKAMNLEREYEKVANQKIYDVYGLDKDKSIQDKMINLYSQLLEIYILRNQKVFHQKQIFNKNDKEINTFHKHLHKLNNLSAQNYPTQYRQHLSNLKQDFNAIQSYPSMTESYFPQIDLLLKDDNQIKNNDNSHVLKNISKENVQKSYSKLKDKKVNYEKPVITIKKKISTNANFPFENTTECKSKSSSKPTFVKKDDIIQTLKKMKYDKKSKVPIETMTKDELCDFYFRTENRKHKN